MSSVLIRNAPNINHLWAQLIVEEFVRLGVTHFFAAPGSRSTPLVAAAGIHPGVRVTMHFDERGTAFAALGYGRATRTPAVWLTTSGTAVANGMPAVVEAFSDGVPLILLTADRPPELRQTGANQTICQPDIFGSYTRWHVDAPAPTLDIEPAFVLTTIDQAVHRARAMPGGPVHLNWMFREPLAPVEGERFPEAYLSGLTRWLGSNRAFTHYSVSLPSVHSTEASTLLSGLQGIERGVVVAGRMSSNDEASAVEQLAFSLQWPLLADIGSQLRLGPREQSTRIVHHDVLLAGKVSRPEAVLHVGRRSTSKRLASWIDRSQPDIYAVVDDYPERFDPSHRVTHRIEAGILEVCTSMGKAGIRRTDNAWLAAWKAADARVKGVLETLFAETVELHEPLVARLVSERIPASHGLFVASSMPVRDLDAFASASGSAVPVAANRGASGIDGSIASAIGYSKGLARSVTLLVGDLGLLHDLNSLSMLRDTEFPLVVIVINNDGGGIFSFLPISRFNQIFEPYFGTPHGVTFQAAAMLFGLNYASPASKQDFIEAYDLAVARSTSTLIELFTDRNENLQVHEAISLRIAEVLNGIIP